MNDEETTSERELSNDEMIEENNGLKSNCEDHQMEEGEKTDSGERLLFQLTVVNSYGSQEVQKLESSKTYKLSGELGSE